MITPFSSMTKTIISPIKQMNPIKDIIRSMRMNQVNNNFKSKWMRLIDKVFEIFRCTKSLRYPKISSNMVAKASVISVFLNSHQLNTVIPSILNPFKIILCKIPKRAHPPKFLSHTDMWLINPQTLFAYFHWLFMSPFKLSFRVPKYTIIKKSSFVLDKILCISWVTIWAFSVRTLDIYFIFCVVRY